MPPAVKLAGPKVDLIDEVLSEPPDGLMSGRSVVEDDGTCAWIIKQDAMLSDLHAQPFFRDAHLHGHFPDLKLAATRPWALVSSRNDLRGSASRRSCSFRTRTHQHRLGS